MKNLKVSSLFHWLYGAVMFLPILLLPVFMIYSHRHTIDSGTLEVPQNEVVDFNQLANTFNYKEQNNVIFTPVSNGSIEINSLSIDGTASDYSWDTITTNIYQENHKYFVTYNDNITGIQMRYDGQPYTTGQEFIVQVTSIGNFSIDVLQDTVLDDVVVTPQVFDLTQMFGSGNEPSIQQFKTWFSNDYYPYTLSKKVLLKDVSTITYSDSDIMSQATYQLYNAVDKYFNIGQFFGFENLWDYMVLNWFGGNVTIYLRIFWQLLTYWLVVSIAWLIFDLFMYVPKLAHRWLDRSAIE